MGEREQEGCREKKRDVSTQSLLNQILAPGSNCCAAVLGLSADIFETKSGLQL